MLRIAMPSASMLASLLAAQDWQRVLPGTVPPGAYGARMTYDAGRSELLWFGGFASTTAWPPPVALAQTWAFANGAWTQRAPAASPPARAHHAIAYVDSMNAVVVFGGVDGNGSPLRDVWWYDGASWHTQYYANGPASRLGPAAAGGQQLTVFGGATSRDWHSAVYYGDTWRWHVASGWTQMQTNGPVARRSAALGWVRVPAPPPSAPQTTLVLHGGRSLATANLGDTWLLQGGTTWVQVPNAGGPAREEHGMAFDPASGHAFFASGHYLPTTSGFANDLWRFDGQRWIEMPTATRPIESIGAAVAIDPARNRLVLLGGGTGQTLAAVSDQQWEFTPPVIRQPFGGACMPGSSFFTVDLAARGTTWRGTVQLTAPMTFALFVVGFGNTAWNGVPLPLSLAPVGLPGCDLLVELGWTSLVPMQPSLFGPYADFQLPVPDVPALYAVDLYAQVLAGDATGLHAASAGIRTEIW